MLLTGSPIDIVERAYDVDASTSDWLEAIRTSAQNAFSGQLTVQAYTFEISPLGAFSLGNYATEPEYATGLTAVHACAGPEPIRRIYVGGSVTSVWTALGDPRREPAYREMNERGVFDVWLALGLDPSGSGFALAFIEGESGRRLNRDTRRALSRIAAHLGAARRLREGLGSISVAPGLLEGADAVVAPDGTVLHAEHDAKAAGSRQALREAARRMDRARLKAHRLDPDEGLAVWWALVGGRWSLVERFESDGRRVLVARRNEPTTRPSPTLTPLERKVIALIAIGRPPKQVAYELGGSPTSIHRAEHAGMSGAAPDRRVLGHLAAVCLSFGGATSGRATTPKAVARRRARSVLGRLAWSACIIPERDTCGLRAGLARAACAASRGWLSCEAETKDHPTTP
jgi:hypothetical protein